MKKVISVSIFRIIVYCIIWRYLICEIKNAKEMCYGIDFGNSYAGMFWIFLAAERYKGIQSENSKGNEPAVYFAYYRGIYSGNHRKTHFGSDYLCADCLHT